MPQELGNTKYYDPSEIGIVINRDYETALARIRKGDIKAVKVNGGYLIDHKELVRYLDEVEALPESIINLRLGKVSPKSGKNLTAPSN